jgi:hypothetical protein
MNESNELVDGPPLPRHLTVAGGAGTLHIEIWSPGYCSDAISMTKRYFTSLLSRRSKAWLIC